MKTSYWQEFHKGILRDNPTFGIVLGICPTLAVTTAAKNGLVMGVAATMVLIGSNLLISLVRKVIPNEIRIPCYIVIIAAFVTMVVFLELNGRRFDAPEAEVVAMMLGVAAGEITEARLAAWIRRSITPP